MNGDGSADARLAAGRLAAAWPPDGARWRAFLAHPPAPHATLVEWWRLEGLLPLAAAGTAATGTAGLDPAGADALRAALRAHAAQVAAVATTLGIVVRLVSAAGCVPLVIKGLPMAEAIFGDDTRRPAGDVDVVAAPGEAPLVLAALLAAGYRARDGGDAADALRTGHGVTLAPAEARGLPTVDVDLHRTLAPEAWLRLPADWVTRQTEAATCRGVPLRVPRAPLGGVHAALHLAAHGFLLRHVADLAGWARRLDAAGWVETRALAARAGVSGLLAAGCDLVAACGLAAVPATGWSPVASARARLLRRLGVRPAATVWPWPLAHGHARVARLVLGLDRRGPAVAWALRRAFAPGDRRGGLARLARPARLLRKVLEGF